MMNTVYPKVFLIMKANLITVQGRNMKKIDDNGHYCMCEVNKLFSVHI